MEAVLELLRSGAGWWALAVVCLAAFLEYFLPFLPGDSVVLAGSLLVVAEAWSFSWVAGAAITGGFAGSAAQYAIGRALLDENGSLRGGRFIERLLGRGTLDRFFERFRRHGMWVIALNRALPGVRAAAFLAAGAARLPVLKTLSLGLLSNAGWSLLVLGAGVTVGGNWQKIQDAVGVYQWIVLAVISVLTLVFIRRRRQRRL